MLERHRTLLSYLLNLGAGRGVRRLTTDVVDGAQSLLFWIYVGSLGSGSELFHEAFSPLMINEVRLFVEQTPGMEFLFDVENNQISWNSSLSQEEVEAIKYFIREHYKPRIL
jgi:hypothetical protein